MLLKKIGLILLQNKILKELIKKNQNSFTHELYSMGIHLGFSDQSYIHWIFEYCEKQINEYTFYVSSWWNFYVPQFNNGEQKHLKELLLKSSEFLITLKIVSSFPLSLLFNQVNVEPIWHRRTSITSLHSILHNNSSLHNVSIEIESSYNISLGLRRIITLIFGGIFISINNGDKNSELHLIMITKDYLGEKHVNFVISMIIIGAIYLIFAAILIYSILMKLRAKKVKSTYDYNYYLILNDDKEIEVLNSIYKKFKDFNYVGIYYVGRIKSGTIFSLYPSKDYELGI
ncbi:hypothetical protein H8356DRAFT_1418980 [Neocallimastix lanati (nom. inval.)]|nr:hypothetical protein H8356DRAFT_1418980 [Neocallimastix sp. JGI-2020a]